MAGSKNQQTVKREFFLVKIGILSGLVFFSVSAQSTPLAPSALEYGGVAFDGDWVWNGLPSHGFCRPAIVRITVKGGAIRGNMVWPIRSSQDTPAESLLTGVIHQDHSIDIKLTALNKNGKTSIAKGFADLDELAFSEKNGRCHYDFILQKI